MNPEEEIEKLLNNIGAVAELLRVMYTALIDQGFDAAQAMYLTGEFLKATIER